MTGNLQNTHKHLREQARKARERASEASAPALREYYRGRADAFQAAADALQRFTYDSTNNPYHHEH